MSAKRFNPKDPRLLAGIAVAITVVVVFNVKTFAPDLFQFGGTAGHPGGQTAESSDLNNVIREATRQAGALRDSTGQAELGRHPSNAAWAGMSRDPFLGQLAQPKTSTQQKRKTPPLVCSAVLISGHERTAIINGASLRRGQTIRGHTIVSIDIDGVRLSKGNKRSFLPVSKKR